MDFYVFGVVALIVQIKCFLGVVDAEVAFAYK